MDVYCFFIGDEHEFINPKVGSKFIAKPIQEDNWCGKNSLIVNVKGKGYYLGTNKYWMERDDELGKGFLLQ